MDASVPKESVDLRSDVVAPPSDAMREAMRVAPIGAYRDDEDPTVAELERRCAERFGKEASLFVPSVTISNLIVSLTTCRPGDAIVTDAGTYVYRHQTSALARLGGIVLQLVPRVGAVPETSAVANAVVARPASTAAPIRLLWMENTHNGGGGAVAGPGDLTALRSALGDRPIAIHVDGARIFNASICLGIPVAELVVGADSISVGFTKGLACPTGCVLVGDHAFIEQARPMRRTLGVSQRKGGVAAAACLVALDTMIGRLADDHETARRLAQIVAEVPGLALEAPVTTNIVRFETSRLGPAQNVVVALAEHGVLTLQTGEYVVRAVTHRGIDPVDMERVALALGTVTAARLGVPAGAAV